LVFSINARGWAGDAQNLSVRFWIKIHCRKKWKNQHIDLSNVIFFKDILSGFLSQRSKLVGLNLDLEE
jgi:hypothetical protein